MKFTRKRERRKEKKRKENGSKHYIGNVDYIIEEGR